MLHVPRGSESSPSASLRATADTDVVLDVMLERLDAFEFLDLMFVKIDVEGAELDVLRGGAETLRRCRPLLLVEIEQRHHREPIAEVFEQIALFGYDGAFLDGSGRLRPLSAFDVERWQLEAVLRPDRGQPYINNFFFSPSRGVVLRDGDGPCDSSAPELAASPRLSGQASGTESCVTRSRCVARRYAIAHPFDRGPRA